MLRQEKPNWVASLNAPNPKEVTYWIDLSSNLDGQIVRCYTDGKWIKLNEEQNNAEDMDIAALKTAVSNLQTSKLDVTTHNSFVEESNAAHNSIIASKADKATTLAGYGITNAYTKTEVDTKVSSAVASKANAADVYTQGQVDGLLSAKADSSTVYTKSQTDSAISTKVAEIVDAAPEALNTLNELAAALGNDPNFAATISAQIGSKANSSDVYTTTQTNQAISSAIASKANSADVYTKSAIDTALSAKANTSDTYTKTGTDNAITAAIANKVTSTDVNTIKIVSTLPTIQENGVLYIKIS